MYVYSKDINYPSWQEQIGSNYSANPRHASGENNTVGGSGRLLSLNYLLKDLI